MNTARLRQVLFTTSVLILGHGLNGVTFGEESRSHQDSLKMITDTAKEICMVPPLHGNTDSAEVSAAVEAKIDKLVARLGKMGVEGAFKRKRGEYSGLLQKDLADAWQDASRCKLNVFDKLVDKLLSDPKKPLSQNKPNSNGRPFVAPTAILELKNAEPSDSGIRVNFLVKNGSTNQRVYFSSIKAVSICPLEKPNICKNSGQGPKDVGHGTYVEIGKIELGPLYRASGELLNRGWIEVPPSSAEGFYFLITQSQKHDFIANVLFEYSIGLPNSTGKTREFVAVKYLTQVLPKLPPDPGVLCLVTTDIKKARMFIYDEEAYLKIYGGQLIES